MACSGVWIEDQKEKGIIVGVTDYHVSEFGDSDWEWRCYLSKENKDKLTKPLQSELGNNLSLKEMIIIRFGECLSTIDFVKYLDDHHIDHIVERL